MDTIFAVSSGGTPSAIAIMRLSGDRAFAAVASLVGKLPEPRVASLRAVRHPQTGELIDRAIVILFPGPNSVTGQDVAELHLHGSPAVLRSLNVGLSTIPGLRSAEPGEFTRRALIAGQVDLTEAEGLADLLSAESDTQRRAALLLAEGGLRHAAEGWCTRTVSLAAALEAVIDHGDEEDLADESRIRGSICVGTASVAAEVARLLVQPSVERLRDGIRVVLAGPPNAGKSTLLNTLVQRDVAIVSPQSGTTRDRIEIPVVRGGIAWLLTDTAGLNGSTRDPVEAMGIIRAREAIDRADILLWLGDGPPPSAANVIALHARADMAERQEAPPGRIPVSVFKPDCQIELWEAMEGIAKGMLPRADLPALNARQRDLCQKAHDSLIAASREDDILLMAEELRAARLAFDSLTGKADVEAVLDALFSRFCIGK